MNLTQIPSSYDNTTYLNNEETTNENVSVLHDVNLDNSDASFYGLPIWLSISMILISTWIIVANGMVLLCLVSSRNVLKNNVNVQLLSLSFTDLLVGITTAPATLYPIVLRNTRYETCALMIYMYFCAQSATLCHSLLICVNRLMTIIFKRTNVTFKTIMVEVLAVWGFCLLFFVIHFLVFARFGETVKQCSTHYLFEGNADFIFALLTIPPLVPPQLCTNIIYVYLFMYIRKRLRAVGTVNVAQKNITSKNKLASSDVEEKKLLKLTTSEDAQATELVSVTPTGQATELVSVSTTGHDSSNSPVKTKIQSLKREPLAGTSADGESKCKVENNTDQKLQTPDDNTRINGTNKNGSNQTSNTRLSWVQQQRAMVTFGIMLMALNVSMTPVDFVAIIEIIVGPLSRGVRFVFVTMAMLNSAFNPLINVWRIKPFRVIMEEKATQIYESLRCRRA